MFEKLIVREKLSSTQDFVRESAQRGEPEGLAVMALEQTAGRGRSGRLWISPPGKNLALSLLLRPKIDPSDAALLGMAASIGIADMLENFGILECNLKWPNDVLVSGLKIAGILPEAAMTSAAVEYVILGIGINVNSEKKDFTPELRDSVTSVLLSTGRKQDLEETARAFLKEFSVLYARAMNEGCGFIPDLWAMRWPHRNCFVMREGVRYKAEGIGADGSLIAVTDDGKRTRLTSGQVDLIQTPEQETAKC